MSDHRKGEPPDKHFRSDRVVMARGRWFVVTRERIDVGPYATKEAAEHAAATAGPGVGWRRRSRHRACADQRVRKAPQRRT